MFWSKVFNAKYDLVVAICDEELIDKKIDTKRFEIKVSKNFYGERIVNEKIAVKLMEKATIGNLIGKDIVALAKKNGFITKENIISINGVPHAQFIKL